MNTLLFLDMNTHSALSLFTSCASKLVFLSNWAFQCLLFEWGALSLRDHRGGREAVIPPRRWSVYASIRGYHHGCQQGISLSFTLFMGHSSWPAWPYFRLVLNCKKTKNKFHLVVGGKLLYLLEFIQLLFQSYWLTVVSICLQIRYFSTKQAINWCLETWIKIQYVLCSW